MKDAFPKPWSRGLIPKLISTLAFLAAFTGVPECHAAPPVNIPVKSRLYEDFELLEIKGLIRSGLLSTRPFSRLEGARLSNEAAEEIKKRPGAGRSALSAVRRLEREFRFNADGSHAGADIRPLENAYLHALYSDKEPVFPSANAGGRHFNGNMNLRAGLRASAAFSDKVVLHINPEYSHFEGSNVRLEEGYLMLSFHGIELLAGRDHMWWGPGFHGSLLMSNNARAFDMVKATSAHPFLLPWKFARLGVLRPTLFLARLEKDRDHPNAKLLGMRLDMKPAPSFQAGLSRVFMFGGKGRQPLSGGDWLDILAAKDSAEHSDSPANGNQLVSIDATFVYVNEGSPFIPFSGVKIYGELGAEDSSGNRTPTGRAVMYGMFLDGLFWADGLDMRVEYVNTGQSERYGPLWYSHGVYTSGYTHRGRVIGHHMGGDSEDLFLRARYHSPAGVVGLEADFERLNIHGNGKKREWYGADLTILGEGLIFSIGAGIERDNGHSGVLWTKVSRGF
ncbi:MAG: capsule assembly Wzi family protein [Thermodesulfobacteriota bacterium]|nr:MAG: capsule assembly Wzi family protein [Thermodesulfobacteriota bacterium]